jgi:hypothetical protein
VEHSHRALYATKLSQDLAARQGKIAITNRELSALTLEQKLPFSFAGSPRLRALADIPCDRKGLSEFAATVHEKMVAKLTSEFSSVHQFALVLDEWSDAKQRQFRGFKVHHCNGGQYRAASIGHLPLADVAADAVHLAEATLRTLQSCAITPKVDVVVSDTASVMWASVRDLTKAWSPC